MAKPFARSTIQEAASVAGVSTKTVSRVILGPPRTPSRIASAAEGGGFSLRLKELSGFDSKHCTVDSR